MIQFTYYSPAEISAMRGDDKLELVIELRERMRDCDTANVAESIGVTEQTVRNFVENLTTLPRATTISAMLRHFFPIKKAGAVQIALSPAGLARIRNRTRNRGRRPAQYVRPVRRSVGRKKQRA